jgi:hypothetical protein
MSDTTGSTPTEGTPDTTPTEALPLADREPIAAAPAPAAAAPASGGGRTRTILEVIGGVVAVGLILMAGAVGFAVGHVTGGDDGRLNLSNAGRELRIPMPGGEGQGRPGRPGEDGFGGRGHQDRGGDGFMGGDDMMPQG